MAIDFKAIMAKKVGGVPVLYIAAGGAVVLAVVAYKMKDTTPAADASGDAGSGAEDKSTSGKSGGFAKTANSVDGADYSGLDSDGTVIVQPQQPEKTEKVEETNETWGKAAIAYAIEKKLATPGTAEATVQAILSGAQLSYEQGVLRDQLYTKLGSPPEGVKNSGTKEAPAQKQFTGFPGKHTVKGSNDNTAVLLARLYYGVNDGLHANTIAAANTGLGGWQTRYPVGTVVTIPAYGGVKYFTTTKSINTFTSVAAKNGLSVAGIKALNPGRSEAATAPLPVGLKVRVQ